MIRNRAACGCGAALELAHAHTACWQVTACPVAKPRDARHGGLCDVDTLKPFANCLTVYDGTRVFDGRPREQAPESTVCAV